MSDAQTGHQPPQTSHISYLPAALWVLLALTAAIRLLAITRPLLGNFATKNVVCAMIARNWAGGAASIWYPTLDLLKGGQRSLVMIEFPISAYLSGWLWSTWGGSLEVWGRVTAVVFSVVSVALMFFFVRRRHGQTAAVAASFALAVSPIGIIYGQSFMLEASLVCFAMGTFYALDRWLDCYPSWGRVAWLATAGVCLALLLLTKIYMLVVLLPLVVMAASCDRTPRHATLWPLAAMLALAVLPAILWYAFAYHTASPDGPYAERIYFSVRRSAADHLPPHPLLGSADFYRRTLDKLGGVVLTPVGLMLLLAGLLDRQWRQHAAWLLAMTVLVLALPRKFYEMDYYYMAVLPPLCVMVGLGWQVIYRRVRPGRMAVAVLVIVTLIFSFRYSLRPAFITPDEDRGVVAARHRVQELTTEEEPVVTVHGTTIDLLYYCNRTGWALAPDTEKLAAKLADYRGKGARYLVAVGNEVPMLAPPTVRGDRSYIYRLPGAHEPLAASQ